MSDSSKKGKYTTPEGSATWELISTACCGLVVFCVGCAAGWNSPSLPILMGPDSPIPLTPTDASTLSSLTTVGHLIAPSLTVVLSRFGRKAGLAATSIPIIVGFGLITVAQQAWGLFLGRFLCGLSLGLALCIPPVYMGEVVSAKLRGSLGITFGTTINGGILFISILAPYLSLRVMACIGSSIAMIATVCIWFIPESPYFLASRGDFDEAEGVLEKLRGKTDVTEELNLIKETIGRKDNVAKTGDEEGGKEAPKNVNAFKLLYTVPGNRKAFIINVLFQFVLQLGGCAAAVYFGQIIFDAMKSGLPSHICVMAAAVIQTVCNFATSFTIDKFGRKPLVFVFGLMSSSCLLIIAIYFYLLEYTEVDVNPYRLITAFAMFGLIFAMNMGFVPLHTVVLSETLDNDIKALATGLVGIFGGVMSFICVKSFLILAVVWRLGYCVPFFGFFVVTCIGTTLILKLLPETKGKTFLEIQKDLNA